MVLALVLRLGESSLLNVDTLRSRIIADQRSEGTSELNREEERFREVQGACKFNRRFCDGERGEDAARRLVAVDRSLPSGLKMSRSDVVFLCEGRESGVECFGGAKGLRLGLVAWVRFGDPGGDAYE